MTPNGDGTGLTGGGTPIVTGGDTTHSGAPGTGSPGNGVGSGTTGTTPVSSDPTLLPALDPPIRVLNPLPFPQLSDFVITGDAARLGIKESWSVANPVSIQRTWTGKSIVNGTPYVKKHRISWSASGKAISEDAAFARLEPGDQGILWCLRPMTAYIDVGQMSVTLPYDPVPGGGIVASVDTTGQLMPVIRNGRVVTLLRNPGGAIVLVRFRPTMPVTILKWGGSYEQREATVPWTAEFEEQ